MSNNIPLADKIKDMMKHIKFLPVLVIILLLHHFSFASVEVIGSLKHTQTSKPGEFYTGEIELQNSGSSKQEIRVYQTDLLYNYEEYTYYDEPVTHKRSNAPWVEFSPKTLVLQPNERAFIQYKVKVPDTDTLNGTFWSILMVESVNPVTPDTSGQLNIQTITRYGVQIITELEDKGKGNLKFFEPVLLTENDNLILAVDIENTGDHYIRPEVSIELYDEEGNSVKKIQAGSKGLFPSTSSRFRMKLEGLEAKQEYQALIIAAGKNENVFGLEYTLYL